MIKNLVFNSRDKNNTMDGCTVKQEFASGSKTATSLGSKTHLEKYIKTQLLCHGSKTHLDKYIKTQLLCHLVLLILHQKSQGKKH